LAYWPVSWCAPDSNSTIVQANASDPIGGHLRGSAVGVDRRRKNRVAASTLRLVETITSMTYPDWSTARYTYRQAPATFT